jgi:hypothetical protein
MYPNAPVRDSRDPEGGRKADPAEDLRVDRTCFSVASLTGPDDSLAWWMERSVEERLQAIERLRRIFYGNSEPAGRLQRVLEVAQLERR